MTPASNWEQLFSFKQQLLLLFSILLLPLQQGMHVALLLLKSMSDGSLGMKYSTLHVHSPQVKSSLDSSEESAISVLLQWPSVGISGISLPAFNWAGTAKLVTLDTLCKAVSAGWVRVAVFAGIRCCGEVDIAERIR